MSKVKTYLLLRHVRIHNANAFSSPLTIGFPAMTAWLGADLCHWGESCIYG